jgi:hypothetical protein
MQQPCTLDKVLYPADGDVIKASWSLKMLTQMLKF